MKSDDPLKKEVSAAQQLARTESMTAPRVPEPAQPQRAEGKTWLSVTVTAPDGTAAASCDGKLVMERKTVSFGRFQANEEGLIKLQAEVGPALLFVRPKEARYTSSPVGLTLVQGENRVHVPLRHASSLAGQVVNGQGRPVDGARVSVVLTYDSLGFVKLSDLAKLKADEKPSVALVSGVGQDTFVNDPGYEIKNNSLCITTHSEADGTFAIDGLPEGAVVRVVYAFGWDAKSEYEKTVAVSSQKITLVLTSR